MIAGRRQYFTPSSFTEAAYIGRAVNLEFTEEKWPAIFDAKQEEECYNACDSDKSLCQKWRQKLTDVLSSRKRSARDRLLGSLRYTFLLSRRSTKLDDSEKA